MMKVTIIQESIVRSHSILSFVLALATPFASGCALADIWNGDYHTLGSECGFSCDGTFCMESDDTCYQTELDTPCVGTDARNLYCSQACTSDDDCAGGDDVDMTCLESCPNAPEAEGICWESGTTEWMEDEVCGEADSGADDQ